MAQPRKMLASVVAAVIVGLLLLGSADPAQACAIGDQHIDDPTGWTPSDDAEVVFIGTVTDVEDTPVDVSGNTTWEDVTFEVETVARGSLLAEQVVIASHGPCDGGPRFEKGVRYGVVGTEAAGLLIVRRYSSSAFDAPPPPSLRWKAPFPGSNRVRQPTNLNVVVGGIAVALAAIVLGATVVRRRQRKRA